MDIISHFLFLRNIYNNIEIYLCVDLAYNMTPCFRIIGIIIFTQLLAMVYFLNGQINIEFAAYIAISSYIGMLIGTRISKLFDVSSLKRYFALVLFASALSVMLKAGGIL